MHRKGEGQASWSIMDIKANQTGPVRKQSHTEIICSGSHSEAAIVTPQTVLLAALPACLRRRIPMAIVTWKVLALSTLPE